MALTDKLTAIADAIRAKSGMTGTMTLAEMPGKIAAIQTGGSGSSTIQNDINFYDYDGTLIASYSLSEAQSLTALPNAPIHEGLTFQGWNYTLEKVKAFIRPMNVGAMYITNDGKTRLYIRIATEGRMNVPLYISQTVANGVTIDWGDRSAIETLAGTGNVNTTHTYASIGDYTITLDPVGSCTLGFGDGSSSHCVLGSTSNNGRIYCNFLKSVRIGDGVTSIGGNAFYECSSLASITVPDGITSIGSNAFYECSSLASINIPESVTSIGGNAFRNCYSLASINIPESVTSIGNYAFQNCYSLASITIPEGVTIIDNYVFYDCYSLASITVPDGITSIGSGAFQNCYSLASINIPESVTSIDYYAFQSCHSLASITIPDGVTSIGNYAIQGCYSLAIITIPESVTSIGTGAFQNDYGMAEYHLKPTTPPALSAINAFRGLPSDCIIYVPHGCLEAYQNATNWATYTSYMREEPA